jgi:pyridoxine kinase
MNILSIQSHVAYGHVGNAAAVFPLQRLGANVWPIHTTQLSNHTGYATWKGRIFDAGMIAEVADGLDTLGILGECDGVLSGYIGTADIGEAILDAVDRVKRANPVARYCCDPVIGDTGRGVFVREGVPQFFKSRALGVADIITPNQFELEHLSGQTTRTRAELLAAVDALHVMGPRIVVVSSLVTEETPEDNIDILVSDRTGRFIVRLPRLPVAPNGAGDALAALFFFHYLQSGASAEAVAQAASSIFGILSRTAEKGSSEMLMIEAQDELIDPTNVYVAERIGEPSAHLPKRSAGV